VSTLEDRWGGGGFGMRGRPAVLYVLWKGAVGWRPAVDVNRAVAVLGALEITTNGADPRGHSKSVPLC
jgi:hypothetical protein